MLCIQGDIWTATLHLISQSAFTQRYLSMVSYRVGIIACRMMWRHHQGRHVHIAYTSEKEFL